MKNIIITGTSRGIGFELVHFFAKKEHNVLAISRNNKPFHHQYKNVTSLSIDITKKNDLIQIDNFISQNWTQVDILINNAGGLINKPFLETSTDDFLDIYKINVFAVAALTKITIPYMKKNAHVITISSMGGIQGSMKFPGLAAYSSSKGAVITLMELLAEEFKNKNIAFNTLALGAVQTEMLKAAFPDYEAPVSAKEMADYIGQFALTGNKMYNGKVLQVSSSTP